MKKFFIMILTIVLIISVAGCGKKGTENDSETIEETVLTPEEEAEVKKTYYKTIKFDDSIISEECNCTVVKVTTEGKEITASYGFNYYTIGINDTGMELVARDGKIYLHTMEKGDDVSESWICATIESGENPFAQSIIEQYKNAIDLSSIMGIEFLETIEIDGVKYDYVQVKTLITASNEGEASQKEAAVEVYFYSDTRKLAKVVSKIETGDGYIPVGATCEITYENVQEITIPEDCEEVTYKNFTLGLAATILKLAAQII